MTFSLLARCEETGQFGMAIATRPIAIGAKCPFVRSHIGGLVVQANGDPRLGPLGLKLLEMGYSAQKVLQELADSDGPANIEWRQIMVIDKDGNTAARTGSSNEEWRGHIARRNVVVAGNRLSNDRVAQAMMDGFEAARGELAHRLLVALEAGRDAGGQVAGQYSSALIVHQDRSYALVDLRVDENDEPIAELRRLYTLYKPLIPYYLKRPSNPSLPRDDDWRKQLGIAGGPR
ncbi:DUF1028 domain-containing protein [Falsiroseomonas oryzae]|uniref:DUF1028 domain-containing protein n=1 Tax=Falsiroseomonas oryzae TaxID=2766473 RepID=UPI0022EB977E|nr:DUF1028 domain-containing protein [Roseomonas sp. MO-31]